MGLLKLRKNKKFSYTPRYYKGGEEGSPFQIKHKFDDYRKTVGSNSGLKNKFNKYELPSGLTGYGRRRNN